MADLVSDCCGAGVDKGACEECGDPSEGIETVDGMVSPCCGTSVVHANPSAGYFHRAAHQCTECLEPCNGVDPNEYDSRPDRPMSQLEKRGLIDLFKWNHLTPGYEEVDEGHIITAHLSDEVAVLVESWEWTAQLNGDDQFVWEAWPLCEVLASLREYGFKVVWTDGRGNEIDDPRFDPMAVDDLKRMFKLSDDEFKEACRKGYVEWHEETGEARATRPEGRWD